MTVSTVDGQRRNLEKLRQDLRDDCDAAYRQLGETLDNVERNRIRRKIDRLEEELQEVEQELAQLGLPEENANQRYLKLQANLPKIDFKEPIRICRQILDQCGREGCGVLVLLQESHSMGGQWCIARVRDLLDEMTQDLKHYQIAFLSDETGLDEEALLDRLAGYVGVHPVRGDLQQYALAIIQKICESLQSGSVVFVELREWDYLSPQDRILSWFVDSFWKPLLSKLPEITQTRRRVKFVIMLVAEGALPQECLAPPLSCTEDTFDRERSLELPLRAWTKGEIQDWLEQFSGLVGPKIDQMAERVYSASLKGIPALAGEALIKHLS